MDELNSDGPALTFRITEDGAEQAVVELTGELDIAGIEQLERAVAPIIERAPRRLVLEVAELRFADSSAIALWVRWATAVDELELRGASPLLRKVISTMGLAGKLQLVP